MVVPPVIWHMANLTNPQSLLKAVVFSGGHVTEPYGCARSHSSAPGDHHWSARRLDHQGRFHLSPGRLRTKGGAPHRKTMFFYG